MQQNTSPENIDISEQLKKLPAKPGVYRMYDATQKLLYVGKAKNLKNRVKSYFQQHGQHTPKVALMVSQIARFDYVVVGSEEEALLLEDTLVKTHQPKYNVLLKDDKKYPWLCLTGEPFARLVVVRNPKDPHKDSSEKNKLSDKSTSKKTPYKPRYFGPYPNPGQMYTLLKLIRKHFPLRQRKRPLFKTRPCMNYTIGSCLGPCQNLVSEDAYQEILNQVSLLLKGNTQKLLESIQQEMQAASAALNYEWAAKLRDRYEAVSNLNVQQKVIYADTHLSQDVIAATDDGKTAVILVMRVREGKLVGSDPYFLPLKHHTPLAEAYAAFLYPYYQKMDPANWPRELLLQFSGKQEDTHTALNEDILWFQEWLTRESPRTVITTPQRGNKQKLMALAQENASEMLHQLGWQTAFQEETSSQTLQALQQALGLPQHPHRMECYDISHVQGTQTVASMVVFTDGKPDKAEYRRFKIKDLPEGKPDDFASMKEVMHRRFSHHSEDAEKWPNPDLVIIDGGKGQLSAAVEALQAINRNNLSIVSLAKRQEEVYFPGKSKPVILSKSDPALQVLQRIRDEAHRFAITYHRTLRQKRATVSILDSIKGLGPKRKQRLLETFKTPEGILLAGVTAVAKELGVSESTALPWLEALGSKN